MTELERIKEYMMKRGGHFDVIEERGEFCLCRTNSSKQRRLPDTYEIFKDGERVFAMDDWRKTRDMFDQLTGGAKDE